jgi:endonuclease/exonuclease/phosphatase family metal-dependent hydrolase
MKILTANIALGLPHMDHLTPVIKGHLAFHGPTMLRFLFYPRSLKPLHAYTSARRVKYLESNVDLRNTFDLIERAQADLVVLNEVLPQFHRETLEPYLEQLGYHTRVWGGSLHYPDATVSTVIASKAPGTAIPIDLSWEEHAGGGAGIAAIRLDDMPVTAIGLHLGMADKFPWLYEKEIEVLAKFVSREQEQGRDVIIAGDWNSSEQHIQEFPSFSRLDLTDALGNIPTCPLFLPWQKPLDHIFIPKSWRAGGVETRAFGSDHLAVTAEVEA